MGEILSRPALRHLHVPPSALRLDVEEDITGAASVILVVATLRLPRLCGQRQAHLVRELVRELIEADGGELRVVRLLVQIQQVFHAPDELTPYLRNAPFFLQPGSEFV